jgi:hypothetical protein
MKVEVISFYVMIDRLVIVFISKTLRIHNDFKSTISQKYFIL